MRDRFYLRLSTGSEFSSIKGMGLHRVRPWLFANLVGISRHLMVDILRHSDKIAKQHTMAASVRVAMYDLFTLDQQHRLSLN